MAPQSISSLYSDRAQNSLANPLIATYRDRASIKYKMGSGLPDSALFPIDELREYASRALATHGIECLSYGMGGRGGFAGPLSLREQIAKRTSSRDGRDLGPDGIVLTSGASHGLALASNAYLSPGDAVLVEALTWPWALRYMTEAGATVVPVPMDDEGMNVGLLEQQIAASAARGLRPKMIYTIPTFHIPTATCMPASRRRTLLDIAQKHDMVVLEDSLYYDLRYRGEPVPSLLAMDDAGLVLQQSGVSKTLATGLRMGWVAGTPDATLPLEAIRQDLGVNQWTAYLLDMWMADGKWDAHLEVILRSARRKHEITLAALNHHCRPYVRFQVPEGGIYYWLELAPDVDQKMFRDHLDAEGVDVAPGERFTGDDSGRRFFRLAYLDVPDDELERSIAKLGECLSMSTPTRQR
jgi:2-aminoadipate transaminase